MDDHEEYQEKVDKLLEEDEDNIVGPHRSEEGVYETEETSVEEMLDAYHEEVNDY